MDDLPAGWNLARRLLEREVGDDRDPRALADALARIWQGLFRVLSPIVGTGGFRAIAMRALNQTQNEFPLLIGLGLAPQEGAPLTGLQDRVAGQEPQQVVEAITYLLAAFLSLVLQLLGFDLSRRLLKSAWPGLGCNGTSSIAGK